MLICRWCGGLYRKQRQEVTAKVSGGVRDVGIVEGLCLGNAGVERRWHLSTRLPYRLDRGA